MLLITGYSNNICYSLPITFNNNNLFSDKNICNYEHKIIEISVSLIQTLNQMDRYKLRGCTQITLADKYTYDVP